MPRETQKPSEMLPQDKPSSRRDLLTGALLGLGTGALLGLGASVLVQANGGVAYARSQSPSSSRTKSTFKKTVDKQIKAL